MGSHVTKLRQVLSTGKRMYYVLNVNTHKIILVLLDKYSDVLIIQNVVQVIHPELRKIQVVKVPPTKTSRLMYPMLS